MTVNIEATYYTLPKVAEIIGVSNDAMRYWIKQKWIIPPENVAGVEGKVYTAPQVIEIIELYIRRAAAGLCRGSGADDKQKRALEVLKNRAKVSNADTQQAQSNNIDSS